MTALDVIRVLRSYGCVEVRQRGSHKMFVSPCGKCRTPVSDHRGDIPRGTLANIERLMAPCLGPKWLTGSK